MALIPFILMYQFCQRYWMERKEPTGKRPLMAFLKDTQGDIEGFEETLNVARPPSLKRSKQ